MNIPITKPSLTESEIKGVSEVIQSNWLAYGRKTEEFERAIASNTNAKYAVAVSSGTAALHLALVASGIKEGNEVICPSFSFIASANAIVYCRAKPVFVDINPNTFNIDEKLIESAITKKTKAIMAIHQFGLPCEINKINTIAEKHNLAVIEDAACALGSEYKGKKIGDGKNVACFSFHPRKIITTGEGGMLVTNDKKVFEAAKSLSLHGTELQDKKENQIYSVGLTFSGIGYNYKLTDIASSIGLVQLKKLDRIVKERNRIAEKYNEAFSRIERISIANVENGIKNNYQSYIIKVKGIDSKKRDMVIKKLNKAGIGARVSIPPIHKQKPYQALVGDIKLPNTEEVFKTSILLPIYPGMTDKQVKYVIDNTIRVVKDGGGSR